MNKYSWIFIATTWSLIAIMYVTFLLISINGNYQTLGYVLGSIDRHIFTKIIQNRIHFFSLIRAFNLCSCIFICSIVIMTNCYFPKTQKSILTSTSFFITIIYSVVYFIFYEPNVSLALYTKMYISGNIKNLIYVFDLLLHIIIYLILMYPPFVLFKNRKMMIWSHHQNLLLLIIKTLNIKT